jgi:hypothetical protein
VSFAAKHYLQTTDEGFSRAVAEPTSGALYDALYHPSAAAGNGELCESGSERKKRYGIQRVAATPQRLMKESNTP